MLTAQQPETRQEYRTAKGWRIFIYLLMPPLTLAILATPFFLWDAKQPGLMLVLSGLLLVLVLFLLYSLLEAHKARHIITADSLVYEGAFQRKVIPLANLRGFRTDQQYTYFYSRDPADPSIRIGYTSESYAAMQQWFAYRYPDLDQQAQEKEGERLLTDPYLGSTLEGRLDTVAQARQTAKLLNGAGVAATAWILLRPQLYYWAVAAGLALPLAAVAALWQHRGALRLDERSGGPYPSVFMALVLPLLALSWRAAFGEFELERQGVFWLWVAGVAVVFALLLVGTRYIGKHPHPHQPEFGLTVVISAFLFGSAGTTLFNYAFDETSATVYPAQVLGKETSSGSTTTYYLKVSPWGPRPTPELVAVPQSFYNHQEVGDSLHVYLHPGRLRLPWLEVKE